MQELEIRPYYQIVHVKTWIMEDGVQIVYQIPIRRTNYVIVKKKKKTY